MKQKLKRRAAYIFSIGSVCWSLTYFAQKGNLAPVWALIGTLLLAILIGIQQYFSVSKAQRQLYKNAAPEEKDQFISSSAQAGSKIGLRLAPVAVFISITYAFLGSATLAYTIPLSVIILIVLCRPAWKNNRERTEAFFQTLEKSRRS